jgi:hypothetical protein
MITKFGYSHNRLEIILGNDKMAGSPRKRKIDRQNETDIPAANHCLYRWRLVFVHIRAAKANPEMVCEFEKGVQPQSVGDNKIAPKRVRFYCTLRAKLRIRVESGNRLYPLHPLPPFFLLQGRGN